MLNSSLTLIFSLQKIRKHMQQRDRNQQAEEEANQQPQNPEGAAENNVNREETDNNVSEPICEIQNLIYTPWF